MATRLKDVAVRAGVSVKTVSNVVNGYPHVTDDTRHRVQEAIDALGYRPNLQARSLRTGRTGVIALGVPRLDEPYFAELAGLVISEADRLDLTVLVEQTGGLRHRELEALQGIRPGLVDGVLLSPLALGAADLDQAPGARPTVLLGERVVGAPTGAGRFDHVGIDNVAAAREATATLLAAGRRRVAVIGVQSGDHTATARLRLDGHLLALAGAGMAADPALHAPVAQFHRADGAAAMARLLDAGAAPDAVFCFNDLLAVGALSVLADRGVRVPDDVAVLGFDDIEECAYTRPALSSVAPDKAALAALAVATLHARIGGGLAACPAEVPYALVHRASTGTR